MENNHNSQGIDTQVVDVEKASEMAIAQDAAMDNKYPEGDPRAQYYAEAAEGFSPLDKKAFFVEVGERAADQAGFEYNRRKWETANPNAVAKSHGTPEITHRAVSSGAPETVYSNLSKPDLPHPS